MIVRWSFILAALLVARGALASETHTATSAPITFSPLQPRLGDVVQIELRSSDPQLKRAHAEVFNYRVEMFRIDADRLRGIAAVPLDIEPMSHLVKIKTRDRDAKAWLQVVDREFDTAELTVAPKFTQKPDAALKKRLAEEQRAWSAMWKPAPSAPRFFGEIQRPVTGIVTAPFGTRRLFNGKTKSRHYGLDLNGDIGDPIYAVQAGRVVMSAMRWASGGTIVIDHGSGLFTTYFHMSDRKVKKGDWVEAGERLGDVGKSGRVTGPHLHLSVIVRMERRTKRGETIYRGLYTDPERFLQMRFEGDPAFVEPRPAKPQRDVQQGKTRVTP